jgi:ParB/RepB/Spo0J family partition protein
MTTSLQNIDLSKIEILSNYRDVEPPSVTDPDVIELSDSIEKHGVMQAILVRLHPTSKDKYQVIFGHRRFLAASIAGFTSIPANIKIVADDDILELQVTENLQRKDVHPMDEAIAFRSLMDKKKYSIEEIASRFAKSPEYIAQRLKLNDMVPDAQKLFKQNKMLLGHALQICRLQPADQKQVLGTGGTMRTVADLRDTIDRSIFRTLSKAPWSLDDADIYPKAGACSSCSKHSGCGNLLFKDITDKDRCFDKACFDTKASNHLFKTVSSTIETLPEVILVHGHNAPDPAILKLTKEMKVKVHKEYTDFYDYSTGQHRKKVKALWLSGSDKGKIKMVYVKGGDNEKNKAKEPPAAEQIAGIKERTKRAAELDDEKVHKRILESLKSHKSQTDVEDIDVVPAPEFIAMTYILLREISWSNRSTIMKKLGFKTDDYYEMKPENLYASLDKMNRAQLTLLIRHVILKKYPGTTKRSTEGFIIRKMAESYPDIPVAEFELEQKEARDKREARAALRIAALNFLESSRAKPAPAAAIKNKPAKSVKQVPAKTKKKTNSTKTGSGLSTLIKK